MNFRTMVSNPSAAPVLGADAEDLPAGTLNLSSSDSGGARAFVPAELR